jgi:hypothetical protein
MLFLQNKFLYKNFVKKYFLFSQIYDIIRPEIKIYTQVKKMKTNVQQLKPSEITSDVFVIAPSQIDWISEKFGDAVAEAMNVRPLSQKIRQIAAETLVKVLYKAKSMGE